MRFGFGHLLANPDEDVPNPLGGSPDEARLRETLRDAPAEAAKLKVAVHAFIVDFAP